jgi:hypothetical protein
MLPDRKNADLALATTAAFLIQVYTETTLQSGIFIKKMPPSTDSKR